MATVADDPLPLFRSTVLSRFPELSVGMSSRQGAPDTSAFGFNLGSHVGDDAARVQRCLEAFLARLDIPQEMLATMNQVHGERIALVETGGEHPATDAIVTRTPGLALAVRTADCVPILCYVPAHNVVAGIHAGWKGSALGIAGKTIAFLGDVFNVEPVDVFCYIGPGARSCCYEVDPDIAAQFDPSVVVEREGRKPRIDLPAANALDLQRRGVPEANIEMENICTVCHPALLHSHRRDGARAGRMLAVIAMHPSGEDIE
jgi:polyphenol oxidase